MQGFLIAPQKIYYLTKLLLKYKENTMPTDKSTKNKTLLQRTEDGLVAVTTTPNKFHVTDADFNHNQIVELANYKDAVVSTGEFKVVKEDVQDYIKEVYTCFGVGKFGPTGAWANFRLDVDFKNKEFIKLQLSPPSQRATANAMLKSTLQKYLDQEQD
jgi:hypothetical protein